MNKIIYSVLFVFLALFVACGTSDSDSSSSAITSDGEDISNAIFTRKEVSCLSYVGSYFAQVKDIKEDKDFTSSVVIEANSSDCVFSSNSIPNHDFNDDQAHLATPVAEVSESFNIPGSPTASASSTALSLAYDNAVLLNGVKLDVLAAACYGVGNEP